MLVGFSGSFALVASSFGYFSMQPFLYMYAECVESVPGSGCRTSSQSTQWVNAGLSMREVTRGSWSGLAA
eukprot:329742-Pelagomonas_calceolata.AAC.5